MRDRREVITETAIVSGGTRLLLRIALAIVAFAVLWSARMVVSWAALALLFALAAHPVVERLVAAGFRRGLAVASVMVTGVAACVLGLRLLVPVLIKQVVALVNAAPDLLERLRRSDTVRWADDHFSIVARLDTLVRERGPALAKPALLFAANVISTAFGAITVVTLTILLLLTGGELFEMALSWISPARRGRVRAVALSARRMVSRYVLGTLIVATIGGTVMGTTLALLGVPYYLPIGLILVFLGLIPYIGGYLGAAIVIVVTLATEGVSDAAIAGVVYLVYQQIEGNVLQPVVQRRTIKMNPVIVSLALLSGGAFAGILGALIAIPVVAALQIVLGEIHRDLERSWAVSAIAQARELRDDDDFELDEHPRPSA